MSAAYTLQEKAREAGLPITFTLFESAPALGGKIVTDQVDGFTVEGGPDSFLAQKPWAAQMAQALGLEPELIGTNPDQKKLYVINRGRFDPHARRCHVDHPHPLHALHHLYPDLMARENPHGHGFLHPPPQR